MSQSTTQDQRCKKFVDNHVQGALIKRVLLHWVALFFVLGIAILGLKTLMADPGLSPTVRFAQAKGDFLLVAILMFALLPVFILDTIRFSNRFVGPIARFRQGLKDLTQKKNVRLKFRQGDFWQEMAAEFNAVSQLLENSDVEVRAEDDQRKKTQTSFHSRESATCKSYESCEPAGAEH